MKDLGECDAPGTKIKEINLVGEEWAAIELDGLPIGLTVVALLSFSCFPSSVQDKSQADRSRKRRGGQAIALLGSNGVLVTGYWVSTVYEFANLSRPSSVLPPVAHRRLRSTGCRPICLVINAGLLTSLVELELDWKSTCSVVCSSTR